MVLFFLAFFTAQFSSKHFILGIFVRSLSTQLFFLLVLLFLLLSMTAFSYVGLLSLIWVWPFHALYPSYLPPSSFSERLSPEQFAELRSVHLLAFSVWACSLAFLSSVSPFLIIFRAVFIYLVFSLISDTVYFSYSEGSFFIFFSDFSCVFYRAFLLSVSVLSSRAALSSGNASS